MKKKCCSLSRNIPSYTYSYISFENNAKFNEYEINGLDRMLVKNNLLFNFEYLFKKVIKSDIHVG